MSPRYIGFMEQEAVVSQITELVYQACPCFGNNFLPIVTFMRFSFILGLLKQARSGPSAGKGAVGGRRNTLEKTAEIG